VYVDNDPLVLAHARALLTSTPEGACDYIDADMHQPGTILRAAARTLDFRRPVAVILLGVLGHVSDDEQAQAIVRQVLAAVPSGSYLVLADSINEGDRHIEAGRQYSKTGAVPYHLRTPAQIAAFFEGLDLAEPGLVPVSAWRPEPSPFPSVEVTTTLAAVGRKS
jgi:O-methyltransferase involved in polyketide biosynthesis